MPIALGSPPLDVVIELVIPSNTFVTVTTLDNTAALKSWEIPFNVFDNFVAQVAALSPVIKSTLIPLKGISVSVLGLVGSGSVPLLSYLTKHNKYVHLVLHK